jgi:hypothetical protein
MSSVDGGRMVKPNDVLSLSPTAIRIHLGRRRGVQIRIRKNNSERRGEIHSFSFLLSFACSLLSLLLLQAKPLCIDSTDVVHQLIK